MRQQAEAQELRARFRGEIVAAGDDRYDEARKLYNGMIDRRPRFIARCADVADVMSAIDFGRENGLLIAVRGGGHNGGGLGSCDDGLVIDLSLMKSVRIDPENRTVRVGPGCTQGEVDHACHVFGLAVPAGIVSTTGISGLALGGGHGYLSRQFGLTIDNLIEADVVLADSGFVTASANRNQDLYWALRGGGGNFGVVTSLLFRAHPVGTVYAGPIFWDFAQAGAIMRWYREYLPGSPEELCVFLGLKTVPSTDPFPREIWAKRICALICCYNGSAEAGERAMKPIREALPEPLLDWVGPMPFPALQALFDPLLPKGLQWYWKGDFVKELPDAAIEAHLANAQEIQGNLSLMHLYPIDGAVHRVAPEEMAWRFRDVTWSMVIAGIDPDPKKALDLVRWGRTYWGAVHPFSAGGAYVNFLMDDEGQERVKASYGTNYQRLADIKAKYDPTNLFRVNQNIHPASEPRAKD
jgi:FAD/FMN-containing dehydrogenase